MATVKLRVSDKVLEKVLWLLGQFDADELEVIEEDEAFLETRKCCMNVLPSLRKERSRPIRSRKLIQS